LVDDRRTRVGEGEDLADLEPLVREFRLWLDLVLGKEAQVVRQSQFLRVRVPLPLAADPGATSARARSPKAVSL
jgi:hypothetical protein